MVGLITSISWSSIEGFVRREIAYSLPTARSNFNGLGSRYILDTTRKYRKNEGGRRNEEKHRRTEFRQTRKEKEKSRKKQTKEQRHTENIIKHPSRREK